MLSSLKDDAKSNIYQGDINMKKTIIAILSVVLVLSLSVLSLVACNKTEEKEQADNAEVLGTAVAVAAQSMAGVSAEKSAETKDDDFQAGINLTVGDDKVSLAAGASVKGLDLVVTPVLEKTVSEVNKFLGENGIKVEKVASDREGYTDKLTISGTYVDDESGESTTYEYALYVGVQGGDGINGKKDYTFNALFVVPTDGEPLEFAFSGTASYDEAKDAMIFDLGAGEQTSVTSAFAGVKAYATKQGTIVVELNAGASVSSSVVADAILSVELGKLDENRYGAVVNMSGVATVVGYGVNFDITLNVYANSTENASEYDVNGKLEATVALPDVPFIGGTYKASADLNGKAKYVAEDDNLEIGLTGNVTFAPVKQEENK